MARVLLDPCSEATLVSWELARKLGCRLHRTNLGIDGVAGPAMDSARHRTTILLMDPTKSQPIPVDAYVLRAIGITTPAEEPEQKFTDLRRSLLLADPAFSQPGRVDAVIGSDAYHRIIRCGMRRYGSLLAQDTIFGWTLTGTARRGTRSRNSPLQSQTCVTALETSDELSHERLLALVQRFWSLEEVPVTRRVSTADQACEQTYLEGLHRAPDGRYIVRLPTKPDKVALLGDSLSQAQSTLRSMQRRMQQDPQLRASYCQFMEEYASLGHMRALTVEEIALERSLAYYIPHHGIWQRSDSGRKLRVVFNASRATTSGVSLNDALHSGPKLQSHISTVIARWRRHRIVFCEDVKMMFRQILIDEKDVHLQRIVWSPSADVPAKHFALQTVTYGTACAPYLALRTMQQLCTDEGDRFPLAREALQQDIYMDDFLIGSHDLETRRRIRDQLMRLLRAGGFHLRKWVTNDSELLADIPPDDRLRPSWVHFSTDGPVRELGIIWDPVADQFKFRSGQISASEKLTKRTALAELASVFDPAGWLTPLTLTAKLIIQDLWRAKFDWDEDLPKVWCDRWAAFRESLRGTADFSIKRWFGHSPGTEIQLHAFSDASPRALAAVVYSRTVAAADDCTTVIISAKSKLASIKSLLPASRSTARMTISRLELRAALIAAQLLRDTAAALQIPLTNCHLWSNSAIALHWLRSEEPVDNDLVDNYIAHIQEITPGVTLHHVRTDFNPADIASRGADTAKLTPLHIWWYGLRWLSTPESQWPVQSNGPNADETLNDLGAAIGCFTAQMVEEHPGPDPKPISQFSSLGGLLRGTVRARRLLQRKTGIKPLDPVTATELRQAYISNVRLCQRHTFASEIRQLSPGKTLGGQTPLKTLSPFLDSEGVLRVGGRLDRSTLPDDERHPVLLDGRSHLAQLVIRWTHERSLHGGFRATYARTIQRAWITGGHVRIKRHLRSCLVCARIAASTFSQLMATLLLPVSRLRARSPSAESIMEARFHFVAAREETCLLSKATSPYSCA